MFHLRIVLYVQIHDGYPADSILGQKSSHESFVIRYDAATRKLVDNYYDATPDAISKVSSSPPVYRFKFGITLPDVKTGDLVAVRVPSQLSILNQSLTTPFHYPSS
jgi:hypothetical protein